KEGPVLGTTNEAGEFSADVPADKPGKVCLWVDHAGYGARYIWVSSGEAASASLWRLGPLLGRVVIGPQRTPVARARVLVGESMCVPEVSKHATTDEEGRFAVDFETASGTYDFVVLAPGRATLRRTDLSVGDEEEVVLRLEEGGGTLGGVVTDERGSPV